MENSRDTSRQCAAQVRNPGAQCLGPLQDHKVHKQGAQDDESKSANDAAGYEAAVAV